MNVRRWYGLRLWRGIPVKIKPFVDAHFEVTFHGIGLWMCPIIPGVLVWKRRKRPDAAW